MMNIYDFKEKSPLNYRLINAVIDQLQLGDDEDIGTLEDIANYGIDGGFCGFIYYDDTVEFYANNQNLILEQLKEDAESFGQPVISLVMGFNCINEDTIIDEVGETLYSHNHDQQVANCLAWYAAETVAQAAIN